MENPQIFDNFKRKLLQTGLKLTPQRKLIFLTLLQKGALTTPEVAALVSNKVDRATVYRTLEVFEETGIINRIWDGWKSRLELSDAFITHHHHATCSICKRGIRIESDKLEDVLHSIAKENKFHINNHVVELYGLCEKCITKG